jgi:hypothetical protein
MRKVFILALTLTVFAVAGPVIRGTGIAPNTVSPAIVPFPTGTAIGDLVIVWLAEGNSPCTPGGGWSTLNFDNASGAEIVLSKTMTSSDITAGSVSIPPCGGALGNGTYAVVAIVGGTTTGIREHPFSLDTSGALTRNLVTSSAVSSSDLGIFFGAVYSCGVASISPGTLVASSPSGGMSGALYSDASLSGGVNTITYASCSSVAVYNSAVILVGANPHIRHSVKTN